MASLREIALPPHFFDIPELKELDRVSVEFMARLYDDIDDLRDDVLITTATEYGIKRRERILGITPSDGESLESRRARVLMLWYDKTPYTRRVIERKLAMICGEGNYEFDYDADTMTLSIALGDVNEDTMTTVWEVLDELIMLMVVIDVKRIQHLEAETVVYAGAVVSGSYTVAGTITDGYTTEQTVEAVAHTGAVVDSLAYYNI